MAVFRSEMVNRQFLSTRVHLLQSRNARLQSGEYLSLHHNHSYDHGVNELCGNTLVDDPQLDAVVVVDEAENVLWTSIRMYLMGEVNLLSATYLKMPT